MTLGCLLRWVLDKCLERFQEARRNAHGPNQTSLSTCPRLDTHGVRRVVRSGQVIALRQFCMAMTGTHHECDTEVQLEELMSLRAKYVLHAWGANGRGKSPTFQSGGVPERLDIAVAVKGKNSDNGKAYWASLVLEAERVVVDGSMTGAQDKQIALKRHVAAKFHELQETRENKGDVAQQHQSHPSTYHGIC